MSAKETVLSIVNQIKEKANFAVNQVDYSKDFKQQEAESEAVEAVKECEALLNDVRYKRQQAYLKELEYRLFREQNRFIKAGDINAATYVAGQVDMLAMLQGRAEKGVKR